MQQWQEDGKEDLSAGKGIYVGESIYEQAKEHVADRVKESEDSHQIKHWLTSHEELLAPRGFIFKIIKTFQDPLSRQLAESVWIDLRGENILNSKAEYLRCRVPRLRIDMEGWKEKVKEKVIRKGMYIIESGDIDWVKQPSGRAGKTGSRKGCWREPGGSVVEEKIRYSSRSGWQKAKEIMDGKIGRMGDRNHPCGRTGGWWGWSPWGLEREYNVSAPVGDPEKKTNQHPG
jgi:hypothetical protein